MTRTFFIFSSGFAGFRLTRSFIRGYSGLSKPLVCHVLMPSLLRTTFEGCKSESKAQAYVVVAVR